jgi:PEP-CTERM motif
MGEPAGRHRKLTHWGATQRQNRDGFREGVAMGRFNFCLTVSLVVVYLSSWCAADAITADYQQPPIDEHLLIFANVSLQNAARSRAIFGQLSGGEPFQLSAIFTDNDSFAANPSGASDVSATVIFGVTPQQNLPSVPEPSTIGLFSIGIGAMVARTRRRFR